MRPGNRPLVLAAALLTLAAAPVAAQPTAAAAAAPAPAGPRDLWGIVTDVSSLRPGDVVAFVQQIRGTQTGTPAQTDAPAAAHAGGRHGVVPQAIPSAPPGGLTVDLGDLSRPTLLESQLRPLTELPAADVRVTVPDGQARLGDFSLGSDQRLGGHLLVVRGTADIYGRLQGNLVTLNGDVVVHPGAVIAGDVLALRGEVRDLGGEITGEVRTLSAPLAAPALAGTPAPAQLAAGERTVRNAAGVLGVFLTLAALGFGLVLFGRANLETVSDTITHSFGRAFMTGLVGQLLLVPTFGMIVVGLVLSVVGILLLPFAVVIYGLLAIVGIVGGYLAVAHALGEAYTRRRMARGELVAADGTRYLLTGLLALFVFWAAWAAFGWVPVAGDLILTAAVLVTWLMGTVGLGAALLSRAGLKEHFAGRIIPPEMLTDEYLWATPQFGVPAVKRPAGPAAAPGPRAPSRPHDLR
jgi:hypothetical protein